MLIMLVGKVENRSTSLSPRWYSSEDDVEHSTRFYIFANSHENDHFFWRQKNLSNSRCFLIRRKFI